MLSDPENCSKPCFLGIIPGETTVEEVNQILYTLGLQVGSTMWENNGMYHGEYAFDSELEISVFIIIKEGLVTFIEGDINPEKQRVGVKREWQAFSPETLIGRYGLPSRIGFFLSRAENNSSYHVTIVYDELDMTLEYSSPDGKDLKICPLSDQIGLIRIKMGKNPEPSPLPGVPLETATTMTMEEFGKLMTGDPGKACFRLIDENMP